MSGEERECVCIYVLKQSFGRRKKSRRRRAVGVGVVAVQGQGDSSLYVDGNQMRVVPVSAHRHPGRFRFRFIPHLAGSLEQVKVIVGIMVESRRPGDLTPYCVG